MAAACRLVRWDAQKVLDFMTFRAHRKFLFPFLLVFFLTFFFFFYHDNDLDELMYGNETLQDYP